MLSRVNRALNQRRLCGDQNPRPIFRYGTESGRHPMKRISTFHNIGLARGESRPLGHMHLFRKSRLVRKARESLDLSPIDRSNLLQATACRRFQRESPERDSSSSCVRTGRESSLRTRRRPQAARTGSRGASSAHHAEQLRIPRSTDRSLLQVQSPLATCCEVERREIWKLSSPRHLEGWQRCRWSN